MDNFNSNVICSLGILVNVTTIFSLFPHNYNPAVPTFMSPPHNSKESRPLLWFDRLAMERKTGTVGTAPLLLKETSGKLPTTFTEDKSIVQFPVKPSIETVGEFKVPPSTHAGYAATWYGLSGVGIFMTQKLMIRGRG